MGVRFVRHISEGSSSQAVPSGYEYVEVWRVILDSPAYAAAYAVTASAGGEAIPKLGDPHPVNTAARVQGIRPAMAGDRVHWDVAVTYKTPTRGTSEENPLDDPPRVRFGKRAYDEVLTHDQGGTAILNSAGRPFDPPLMQEKYILVLSVQRNEARFNPILAESYFGAVNNAAVTLCALKVAARKAKCVDWSGSWSERNGIAYWAVSYEVEFKGATWDRKVLDQGLYYIENIGGWKWRRCKDDEGEDAQEAMLLNGSGAQLAAGAAAQFLTWQTRTQRNFARLRLNIV